MNAVEAKRKTIEAEDEYIKRLIEDTEKNIETSIQYRETSCGFSYYCNVSDVYQEAVDYFTENGYEVYVDSNGRWVVDWSNADLDEE